MKTKSQTELSFDAYKNYKKVFPYDNPKPLSQEDFIERIKTDDTFAKEWGNFNYNETFNTNEK